METPKLGSVTDSTAMGGKRTDDLIQDEHDGELADDMLASVSGGRVHLNQTKAKSLSERPRDPILGSMLSPPG